MGGEYVNHTLITLFDTRGISHQKFFPHTPEQNGVAERKHRHIVEMAISLISKSFIPLRYWYHAFACAVFLINRLPSRSLGNRSPFEVLIHKPPDYTHLRVFGCACYPLLHPYVSHKLQPRTTQCVFIGYSLGYKCYLCVDPLTERIYISWHVVFDEHVFPFALSLSNPQPPISSPNFFCFFYHYSYSSSSFSAFETSW